MPRKKTKNDDAAGLTGGVLVVPKPAVGNGQAADAGQEAPHPAAASSPPPPNHEPQPSADPADHAAEDTDLDPMPDAFIGHRPLIRATLPKTENDVPIPRAIPEFTMHQRPGRGFGGRGFRPHGFGGQGAGNGAPPRDGNGPDGNRAPGPGGPGGPGGKSRHRRRHRRPR